MKKRRLLLVPAIVLIVLILIGFIIPHPIVYWDSGYPSNQFRIRVTDSKGAPITTATLSVVTKSNELAYRYPIEEFSGGSHPQADDSGTIVVHHTGGGIEFGGQCMLLFGIIPCPTSSWSDCFPPKFYLHITAQGYKKKSLRYGTLANYECTVEVMRQVEIEREIENISYGVVEKTVVLKRK